MKNPPVRVGESQSPLVQRTCPGASITAVLPESLGPTSTFNPRRRFRVRGESGPKRRNPEAYSSETYILIGPVLGTRPSLVIRGHGIGHRANALQPTDTFPCDKFSKNSGLGYPTDCFQYASRNCFGQISRRPTDWRATRTSPSPWLGQSS